MFKQLFISLIFLFYSYGFSGEIIQGTLTNGISYYLCPDGLEKDVKITVFVKKPRQLMLFAPMDAFFKSGDSIFFSGESTNSFGYWIFNGTATNSLREGLICLSKYLKVGELSREDNQMLCEECYKESQEIEQSEAVKMFSILYGYEVGYLESLFSKADCEIHKIFQDFFEPCRIALMITGSFDSQYIERELESLFGEIVGSGTFIDPIKLQKSPIIISLKGRGLADAFFNQGDDDDGTDLQKVYFYSYEFNRSVKNYVLNDLFLFTHFENNIAFKLSSIHIGQNASFPFLGEIPSSQIDESIFAKAKKELEEIYRNDNDHTHQEIRCMRHFMCGITNDLKPLNENFLLELEGVSLSDLNDFIKEHIKNIPVSHEFEF